MCLENKRKIKQENKAWKARKIIRNSNADIICADERELMQCSNEMIAHTTVYDIQIDIQGGQKAVIPGVHNYWFIRLYDASSRAHRISSHTVIFVRKMSKIDIECKNQKLLKIQKKIYE